MCVTVIVIVFVIVIVIVIVIAIVVVIVHVFAIVILQLQKIVKTVWGETYLCIIIYGGITSNKHTERYSQKKRQLLSCS